MFHTVIPLVSMLVSLVMTGAAYARGVL